MKIYTALQIGAYHLNHCEDYLITAEIGNQQLLCAVMDGCTMGKDSYFISTYLGKLLLKIAKETGYQQFYRKESTDLSLEDSLKGILKEVFDGLLQLKSQLLLEQHDLLTTLIIMLLDKKSNTGILLAVGDGVVCINGITTEFERDNKPDYLGFHLHENFESWYNAQTQKLFIDQIKDISLATDGITLFAKLNPVNTEEKMDVLSYLLIDVGEADREDMLERKLKRLQHGYGLQPTDDLAIIRVLNKMP